MPWIKMDLKNEVSRKKQKYLKAAGPKGTPGVKFKRENGKVPDPDNFHDKGFHLGPLYRQGRAVRDSPSGLYTILIIHSTDACALRARTPGLNSHLASSIASGIFSAHCANEDKTGGTRGN